MLTNHGAWKNHFNLDWSRRTIKPSLAEGSSVLGAHDWSPSRPSQEPSPVIIMVKPTLTMKFNNFWRSKLIEPTIRSSSSSQVATYKEVRDSKLCLSSACYGPFPFWNLCGIQMTLDLPMAYNTACWYLPRWLWTRLIKQVLFRGTNQRPRLDGQTLMSRSVGPTEVLHNEVHTIMQGLGLSYRLTLMHEIHNNDIWNRPSPME